MYRRLNLLIIVIAILITGCTSKGKMIKERPLEGSDSNERFFFSEIIWL